MKKVIKKSLAMALVFVLTLTMGFSAVQNAKISALASTTLAFSTVGLVSVTILETETEILTALLALEDVDNYIYKLENEIGYRESQVDSVRHDNAHQYNNEMQRCPPPPFTSYYRSSTSMMDINNIEAYINAGGKNWPRLDELLLLLTWPAISAALNKNFIVAYVIFTFNLAEYLINQKLNWYRDSIAMIISGDISGVCRCLYVNTGSDYPKAMVYETRV